MNTIDHESKIEKILTDLLYDRDACKYFGVNYNHIKSEDYETLREAAKVIYYTAQEKMVKKK